MPREKDLRREIQDSLLSYIRANSMMRSINAAVVHSQKLKFLKNGEIYVKFLLNLIFLRKILMLFVKFKTFFVIL